MQYVGARYVPKFMGTYDPTQSYENMVVVDNGMGTSYISKVPVPANKPLTDTDYWAIYGASSGAIINLQNQIGDLDDLNTTDKDSLVDAINENVSTISGLTSKIGWVTPQEYGAVADGITDDTQAIQDAIDDSVTKGLAVFLPEGTYLVTNTINIPPNAQIFGCAYTHQYANAGKQSIIYAQLTNRTQPVFNISDNLAAYTIGSTDRTTGATIKNIEITCADNSGHYCAIYGCITNCLFENMRISKFEIGIALSNSYRCTFNNVRTALCKKSVIMRSCQPLMRFINCYFAYVGDQSLCNAALDASVLALIQTFTPYCNVYPTAITLYDCENCYIDSVATEGCAYGIDNVSGSIYGENNNFEWLTKALVICKTLSAARRLRSVINLHNTNCYITSDITTCIFGEISFNSTVILHFYNVSPANVGAVLYDGATHNQQAFCIVSALEGYIFESPLGFVDSADNALTIPIVANRSHADEESRYVVDFQITDFTNWGATGTKIKLTGAYQDMNTYFPVRVIYNDNTEKTFFAVRTGSNSDGFRIWKSANTYVVPSDLANAVRMEVKFTYRLMDIPATQ